jgi:fluoroacetyl-CoA thioesterase
MTEADTAAAVGSGEVPVLATPRVLALAERATVAVEAVLERVAGRRLVFVVRLRDGGRAVAGGHITRVVVDAAAFLRDAGAGAGAPRCRSGVASMGKRPAGSSAAGWPWSQRRPQPGAAGRREPARASARAAGPCLRCVALDGERYVSPTVQAAAPTP